MHSGAFVGISQGKKRHTVSVHLFIDSQRSFACPILNYNGYVIELLQLLRLHIYILQEQAKLAFFFSHFHSVQERIP